MNVKSGSGLVLCVCCFFLLFSNGCSYKGHLATQNFAGLYKPDQQLNGLSYAVFNANDSISFLYYRFPVENLKFKKVAGKTAFASYKLDYKVFDGYKKGVLIDSGSRVGVDSVLLTGMFTDSIQLRTATGRNYIIQVNFSDLNSELTFPRLIDLPKLSHGLSSDYLLTDAYNKPLMRNWISRAEKVRIRTRFPVNAAFNLMRYDFTDKTAAKSPYSFSAEEKTDEIDSGNEININSHESLTEPFNLVDEGIFLKGQSKEKLKIFRFYDGFPKIGSANTMRESLRYISTDEEVLEMMSMPAKAAVDNFWIGLTGNSERALSQIKRYYSRVESANELFSVSGEGWLSDRGMVYIVFGPPNIVYRNAEVEEWTYGEPGNTLSVRFYFHPIQNSIGIEDYKLLRLEEYRRPWHLAVSNWRR